MKIRDEYILHKVAGENIVISSGADMDLNQMITLNDTGAFLWHQLEQESTKEELLDAVLQEYDVSKETAAAAVERFLTKLRDHDFLQ